MSGNHQRHWAYNQLAYYVIYVDQLLKSIEYDILTHISIKLFVVPFIIYLSDIVATLFIRCLFSFRNFLSSPGFSDAFSLATSNSKDSCSANSHTPFCPGCPSPWSQPHLPETKPLPLGETIRLLIIAGVPWFKTYNIIIYIYKYIIYI